MRHVDWKQDYPEVPDLVHRSVLDTLSSLDEQEEIIMKKSSKKRIWLLSAACIALIGTTAAAAEIFQWNERASQVFEADEETKDELTMNQIAQEVSQSVTDQGLTITAIQTIQDKNRFYALWEVTAEDTNTRITPDYSLDYTLDFGDKEDPFCALTWGFVDETEQEISNTRYFEIYGTKHEQSEENLIMNLTFTTLRGEPAQKAGEGEVLLSGTWGFTLDVHPYEMVPYELGGEYQLSGYPVHVLSVSLSPLSMEIIYDGNDVRNMETKEQVNLDQLDELTALYPTGVKYQDGTTIEEDLMIPLTEGFGDGEAYYRLLLPFRKIVDPKQVSEILMGEDTIPLR